MTQDLNSVFNEFENTIQRSQRIASQANHVNRLQTNKLGLFDYSDEARKYCLFILRTISNDNG
jgi:hypothetical protein